jgi:hypothetical protein
MTGLRIYRRFGQIGTASRKYKVSQLDTCGKLWQNKINPMSCWNAKTSTLILLGSVVFVVLLLVVLPDVDPPDTAFHRGTAPVSLHAQANAVPPVSVIASGIQISNVPAPDWASLRLSDFTIPAAANFVPILLRSIRC